MLYCEIAKSSAEVLRNNEESEKGSVGPGEIKGNAKEEKMGEVEVGNNGATGKS